MRRILLTLAVMVICSGQICIPTAGTNGDGQSTAKTATLAHWGFDFSEGVSGSEAGGDVDNADGETIGWSPWPTVWTDGGGTSVWWRSRENTADTNFTKDMGEVTLASVTTVPTTWDGTTDASLPALQVNHVYVVKCIDGYAKFLVTALRVDTGWEADVEYEYTSGTSF